ncbi:THUMP domain-containing class I SAM-dependent RNA methyltransferase [Rhodohalobacter halophilus]|uniref:THUMP domain-containing class I SAM-dependent RNA methyltransferase n=1 Tax=Rhodohalobacter halophilus TaxID=1812810 RepID=UPI001FE17744|nr:class I SAM-dependent RNA methyltransferase [Rhodohalobacter halophilus]
MCIGSGFLLDETTDFSNSDFYKPTNDFNSFILMADFNKKSTVSITCPLGLAPLLEKEVRVLGFEPKTKRKTGVEIEATLNDCILLNFWLRTAHRVHYMIDEKPIKSPDQLRNWLKKMPWEEWISENGYFSVTSRVDHPTIDNDQFANLVVKDAVVDRIRFKKSDRPDSGSNLNDTVLFLFWNRRNARIFIDTSGESLSRRNYRSSSVAAPMQETLASAIVQSTRWKPGQEHFINPMTGSGTIAIEAVMIALNRAPASLRNNFGFMHVIGYDESYYQQVRDEAKKKATKDVHGKFIATDNNPQAIIAAKKNAKTAGVDHLIDFQTCEYDQTPIPDGDGVVVFNPPYGMRLEDNTDLRPLYKGIGDFMKKDCPGKTGYVFTANMALAKKVGLRAKSRTTLFNSTLECKLFEYELYKGSK